MLCAVEFQRPLRHLIKEVAVVGHKNDAAGGILPNGAAAKQPILRPNGWSRLVQHHHVGLGQQEAAQRNAALFPARQLGDIGIIVGAARSAPIAISILASMSQASAASICSCRRSFLPSARRIIFRHLHGDFAQTDQNKIFSGHSANDIFPDRLGWVEIWFLSQIAHFGALGGACLPVKSLSRPAIIFKRLDLPEPLTPTTPIFASG